MGCFMGDLGVERIGASGGDICATVKWWGLCSGRVFVWGVDVWFGGGQRRGKGALCKRGLAAVAR